MMTHFTATSLSPIGGLDLWGDRRLSNLMCLQCTGAAKKSHGKRWLEFYELLPSLFGLPPWAELLKEREAMCVFVLLFCQPSLINHLQGIKLLSGLVAFIRKGYGGHAGATNQHRSISLNFAWTKWCELIAFRAFP